MVKQSSGGDGAGQNCAKMMLKSFQNHGNNHATIMQKSYQNDANIMPKSSQNHAKID